MFLFMSEERKIKIHNRSKGHHDYVFQDPKRIIPIPAGGFAYIPLDEVHYRHNSSASFSSGILEIDPSEEELLEELGYTKRNPNALTEQDIFEILNGSLDEIKEKFDEVNEVHAFHKIMEIARTMDLTYKKVKFIEDLTNMQYDDELIKEEKKQVEDKKKDKK